MRAVKKVYGFDFPPEVESFHEFWQRYGSLCSEMVGVTGPFDVLAGEAKPGFDPGREWPRYYLDPPELFTVMVGHTDGLHWGYWFDDPDDADSDPVVVSYFHGDGLYQLGVHAGLFHALRKNLELFHRDAERYAEDDPGHADEYEENLEEYARIREALGEYDLGDRDETGEAYLRRYPHDGAEAEARARLVPTRSGMGVVAPPFTPVAGRERFLESGYVVTDADVAEVSARTRVALERGSPGAALALGHDLWGYGTDYTGAAREMLDLAYTALGRPILRDYLLRACDFRAQCDRQRRT
jgi:hypothetical protein